MLPSALLPFLPSSLCFQELFGEQDRERGEAPRKILAYFFKAIAYSWFFRAALRPKKAQRTDSYAK